MRFIEMENLKNKLLRYYFYLIDYIDLNMIYWVLGTEIQNLVKSAVWNTLECLCTTTVSLTKEQWTHLNDCNWNDCYFIYSRSLCCVCSRVWYTLVASYDQLSNCILAFYAVEFFHNIYLPYALKTVY